MVYKGQLCSSMEGLVVNYDMHVVVQCIPQAESSKDCKASRVQRVKQSDSI